jgi:hypothetical protein
VKSVKEKGEIRLDMETWLRTKKSNRGMNGSKGSDTRNSEGLEDSFWLAGKYRTFATDGGYRIESN